MNANNQALPYAGTSGWSGSKTSEQRALDADCSGVTGKRQAQVLDFLSDAGTNGLTWKELSDLTGWHHGTASGVLSVLHKTGLICRLKKSRNRCRIYVTARNVLGREIEPHGRSKKLNEVSEFIESLLKFDLPVDARASIEKFLNDK